MASLVFPATVGGQQVPYEVFRAGELSSAVEFGRVGDVVQDPSTGRVFIADEMARTVTVMAADGTLLSQFGRAGDGPGEFSQAPTDLALRGGQLFVADGISIQRFSLDGEFLGRIAFQPENRVSVIITLDSGPDFFLVGTREAAGGGQHFGIYRLEGGRTHLLARIPFELTPASTRGDRRHWGVAGSSILITEPRSAAVAVHARIDEEPVRVAVDAGDRRFRRADVQARREQLSLDCSASMMPGECRRAADDALRDLAARSGTVPPLGPVVGDSEGRWVLGRADGPGDLFSYTYRRFSLYGSAMRPQAQISIPEELRPASYSEGVLWGVSFGEFDEPIVVGYKVAGR